MEKERSEERHFAVSKAGVLTSIKEAHESDEAFYCPHCGKEMTKKCGKIRRWHFAHKKDEKGNCSYESYLHSLAKLRLKQWFEKSESILIQYPMRYKCQYHVNCIWKSYNYYNCIKDEKKTCDLKKHLNQCLVEQNLCINGETYRPDLLWQNSHKTNCRIFIEIKVTHGCTEKKINSNERIIEFEIQSEDDVEKICSQPIQESDTVHFYGFKKEDTASKDKINHPLSLNKFILYQSGLVYANIECNCMNYQKRHPSALFEVTTRKDLIELGKFCNICLALAANNEINVRHCNMCVHHKYDKDEESFLCEQKEIINVEGKDANKCPHYEFNIDYQAKLLAEYNGFRRDQKFDVWKKQ